VENREGSTWDIQAIGLRKSFGGAVALDGADFGARYGEVHALLGENGAGKSTFVRILTGALRADGGQLTVGGAPLSLASVRDGIARDIDTVFQELSLVPDLTVAENLLFGRQPRNRLGLVDRRAMNRRAQQILDDLGVEA
jgi:ABC-type sugar transport system ATPase subunit